TDPHDKYALYNLGVIEQSQNNPVGAEAYYRLALSVDPAFPSALYNLALVRTDAGATTEAIDLLNRLLVVEPQNAAGHVNLGRVLAATGRTAEAQAEYQKARQINPAIPIPTAVAISATPTGPR